MNQHGLLDLITQPEKMWKQGNAGRKSGKIARRVRRNGLLDKKHSLVSVEKMLLPAFNVHMLLEELHSGPIAVPGPYTAYTT